MIPEAKSGIQETMVGEKKKKKLVRLREKLSNID